MRYNILKICCELFCFLAIVPSILLPIISIAQVQASKKSTTATPVGSWSDWGPWPPSCSKTCGIGVRRRTRTCSYTGAVRQLRCKGPSGQLKSCDTKVMCPIHGGWAPWTSWRCTVSCGGGEGSQRRTCTNPIPMYSGKDCEGPAEEFGKCNTQKCPDEVFTMSPDTVQAIKSASQEKHNFEKPEGGTVKVSCSPTVVTKIYKEYPMTKLSWTKDGRALKLDHERMEVIPTELSIEKLNKTDVGIYSCSIQYAPEVVKRVTVAALSVISSKPDIEVHEDESMSLMCKGQQLTMIFGNTTQQWTLEGKVVKDFGSDSPMKHKWHKVKHVKKNSTGKWSCRIQHKSSNREWTTNIVVVKVLPARSKIVRYLTDPKFLLAAAVILFLFMMLAGLVFAYVIVKARDEFKEEFAKWTHVAKWEGEKYGGVPAWAKDYEGDDTSSKSLDDDSNAEDEKTKDEERKLLELSD